MLNNGAAGYQTDSATGLQLLGHRYYDPSIGRFLSSDPAQAGTNWYAYCDNNPLVGCDPTGLIRQIIWDGMKWTAHIGDADMQKGSPHWDGPHGSFIGNDGKYYPHVGAEPKKTNDKVKREVETEVEKLKERGFKIIPPRKKKEWEPIDDTGIQDDTSTILPVFFPEEEPEEGIVGGIEGVGNVIGDIGRGIGEGIGKVGGEIGRIVDGIGSGLHDLWNGGLLHTSI